MKPAGARPARSDDFSLWLEQAGAEPSLVAQLRAIDFYFLNLSQLRQTLLDVFRQLLRGSAGHREDRAMRLLDRYEEIVGHQEVERLRRLAVRLAGKRIVHVNSTRIGGGVAEILGWMVPLMHELGIDASWEVIAGPPDFYRVTKPFHNGLQGLPVSLRKSDFDLHYEVNRENAAAAESGGRRRLRPRSAAGLPAALHAAGAGRPLDLAVSHRRLASQPRHLETPGGGDLPATMRPSSPCLLSRGRWRCPMFLIQPSIDPLSDKNRTLPESERLETLAALGIDPERPLLLQVSRFDRFKDPLGVIEAYRLIKPYYPEMQLALAGGPADDDPEGPRSSREVLEQAGRRPQSEGPACSRPTPTARSTPCSARRPSCCRSRSRRVSG